MIIYIRHADDDGHGPKNNTYKHDKRITKIGRKKARKLVRELVEKYGYPSEISFSPFYRCRDTVRAIIKEIILLKTGKNEHFCLNCDSCKNIATKLICDSRLSRYFTKEDRRKPSVSPSTLKFGIPIKEKKRGLEKRMDDYVKSMKEKEKGLEKDNNIIWCITHAIIYKRIAKRFDVHTNDHIEFLEYFNIEI